MGQRFSSSPISPISPHLILGPFAFRGKLASLFPAFWFCVWPLGPPAQFFFGSRNLLNSLSSSSPRLPSVGGGRACGAFSTMTSSPITAENIEKRIQAMFIFPPYGLLCIHTVFLSRPWYIYPLPHGVYPALECQGIYEQRHCTSTTTWKFLPMEVFLQADRLQGNSKVVDQACEALALPHMARSGGPDRCSDHRILVQKPSEGVPPSRAHICHVERRPWWVAWANIHQPPAATFDYDQSGGRIGVIGYPGWYHGVHASLRQKLLGPEHGYFWICERLGLNVGVTWTIFRRWISLSAPVGEVGKQVIHKHVPGWILSAALLITPS